MFKAKLKKASVLKKLVESIKDFVTIANFDILPTGIFIQSLDQIKVSLVMLEMKSSGFVEYDVELPIVLGINFSNLSTIMKTLSQWLPMIIQTIFILHLRMKRDTRPQLSI